MSKFTDRFDATTSKMQGFSIGYCPNCQDCANEHGMDMQAYNDACEAGTISDDCSFSSYSCDICGQKLGGERMSWHWISKDGDIKHERSACVDCLLYWANGDEPDMEY